MNTSSWNSRIKKELTDIYFILNRLKSRKKSSILNTTIHHFCVFGNIDYVCLIFVLFVCVNVPLHFQSNMVKTYDDSIFTVKVGPSTSKRTSSDLASDPSPAANEIFVPPARMSASLAVKSGTLYMYGGQIEEEHRNLTLSDFYSLDVHKLDEWRTIVPYSTSHLEWAGSDESSDDSEGDDSGEDSLDDDDDDDEEDSEGNFLLLITLSMCFPLYRAFLMHLYGFPFIFCYFTTNFFH